MRTEKLGSTMAGVLGKVPSDYSERIKRVRERLGLTQVQLAKRLDVSFASINRWENGQTRPTLLAWRNIEELESAEAATSSAPAAGGFSTSESEPVVLAANGHHDRPDFRAAPDAVRAVAEAERLQYGYLYNPAYAAESARIDPLPHQRLAVYEHLLPQPRLRFLLADDAGAGKTIMTGLYLREMLSRSLLKRILIVAPAGLVGNWERELRTLFGLSFSIVTGASVRSGNPFAGAAGNRVIVSIDTLASDRVFAQLADSDEVNPYDIAVFDECHKLSADRDPNGTLRRSERYRVAEALAGCQDSVGPDGAENRDRQLTWSCRHLLLLSATPHMGKDFPYYALWRLLEPEMLPTPSAFEALPGDARRKRFLRRVKEEMVDFEGRPLYPRRLMDTLSYDLNAEEKQLYEETTEYLRTYYNRAAVLNRSAARLALSVFQRRLASSTFALLRSLQNRLTRLDETLRRLDQGGFSSAEKEADIMTRDIPTTELRHLERTLNERADDDEDAGEDGREDREASEERALAFIFARSRMELEEERGRVQQLVELADRVHNAGRESKFERLRELLSDPAHRGERLIIFTEHRDTLAFLVRRLEGIGFSDQVAIIHGGLGYRAREVEVERFRRPAEDGGALILVATDAAGEGINLQFCGRMVNYDIPWNPARLEQRMGRIHRYGQKRPVVTIANLVSSDTREGRVMKTLLEKMERIRDAMEGSEKVFDVIGRVFAALPLRDYLEGAAIDGSSEATAIRGIEGALTPEQVKALAERERVLYGEGGEVQRQLGRLRRDVEQEVYRRLLPGYVRAFLERAAPQLGMEILPLDEGGDADVAVLRSFRLAPATQGPAAASSAYPLLEPLLETYPESVRRRFIIGRVDPEIAAIRLLPGDPVFERIRLLTGEWLGPKALRGAVFIDAVADRPYLLHLGHVSVVRRAAPDTPGLETDELLETRLVALRQERDGPVEECPPETLLLLGNPRAEGSALFSLLPPSARRLAGVADVLRKAADYLRDTVAADRADVVERDRRASLAERRDLVLAGFNHMAADLLASRQRIRQTMMQASAVAGVPDESLQRSLDRIRKRQASLDREKEQAVARLEREVDLIGIGPVEFIAHALVIPDPSEEARMAQEAQVEAEAMRRAIAYEEQRGAVVVDVSTPEKARLAGLSDWPGFDLLSHGPAEGEERAIEVKGRALLRGDVALSENEWARACNLRERYWLYVVYGCAMLARPRPPLCVRDPFRLLVRYQGVRLAEAQIFENAEADASL